MKIKEYCVFAKEASGGIMAQFSDLLQTHQVAKENIFAFCLRFKAAKDDFVDRLINASPEGLKEFFRERGGRIIEEIIRDGVSCQYINSNDLKRWGIESLEEQFVVLSADFPELQIKISKGDISGTGLVFYARIALSVAELAPAPA